LFFNLKTLPSADKCGCLKLLFQPGNLNSLVVVNFFLSQEINKLAKLACVHDSARPLVLPKDISKVIKDATAHGAAVLGVPVKATIKEVSTFCQFLPSFLLSMCAAFASQFYSGRLKFGKYMEMGLSIYISIFTTSSEMACTYYFG
jgi:hypothetical protein